MSFSVESALRMLKEPLTCTPDVDEAREVALLAREREALVPLEEELALGTHRAALARFPSPQCDRNVRLLASTSFCLPL